MPAVRAGLFDSLRGLLRTSAEIAGVRLELLATDLEVEKLRFADAALRALLGLMLVGLGVVLLAGFVLLLLWDGYRLAATGVLALLFLLAGALLLQAARRRLHDGGPVLAATRAEIERDAAALRDPGLPS
jgi:uncharacterized membrane protein YqjE